MDRDLMLDSSSSDTSAENREIRRHFQLMAEMKRNTAKRDREKRKPKRPLSAYNLFFKAERENILKAKRKVGFSDMAKEIAAKWKALDDNDGKQFDEEALHEKRRYKVARSQWKAQAKLDSKKSIAYQGQHIRSLWEYVPTLTSLVDQNEPDPNLLLDLYVQQRVAEEQQMKFHLPEPRHQVQQLMKQPHLQEIQNAALSPGPLTLVQQRMMEEQQMRQVQLQNATLVAGPRRMSESSFATSTVVGTEKSDERAALPMSLQGSIGDRFSLRNMTKCHQRASKYSVPPLRSFEAHNFDPVDFLEPYAYGASGGDGASIAPELANAFMNMPLLSDIDFSDDENDETYDPMISRMLEPSPIRRSSLPCLSNDSLRYGALQHRHGFSMPICGVTEMNEVQEIMHLLESEVPTEDEW